MNELPPRVKRLALIGAMAISFALAGLLTIALTSKRYTFDLDLAQNVVAHPPAPLDIDGVGVVYALPPDAAKLAADGRAYVTIQNGTMQHALFVSRRGKGANLQGVLYSTVPLTTGTQVPVVCPTAPPIAERVKGNWNKVYTAQVEVTVEEQLRPNWYSVWRDAD